MRKGILKEYETARTQCCTLSGEDGENQSIGEDRSDESDFLGLSRVLGSKGRVLLELNRL